jgi:hypothetical protein
MVPQISKNGGLRSGGADNEDRRGCCFPQSAPDEIAPIVIACFISDVQFCIVIASVEEYHAGLSGGDSL